MQQKHILKLRDFWAGAMMVMFGAGTVLEASSYRLGTLARMGPGFYPLSLGVILIFLGLLIPFVTDPDDDGVEEARTEPSGPERARGMLCIIAGIVAFMVLGIYGGLAPAIFGLVFTAAMGDASHTIKSAALLALGMTALGALIFSWGLQLQFPLIRWV